MKRVVTTGFETALDHTFSYLGRYLLLGLLPIGFLVPSLRSPGISAVLAILHLVSVAVLFPGALAINALALRLARDRTWDRHPWRAWVGASLGVALVWSAVPTVATPPEFLCTAIGPELAAIVHVNGVLMLASAVALVTAWLVPSSRTRQVQ